MPKKSSSCSGRSSGQAVSCSSRDRIHLISSSSDSSSFCPKSAGFTGLAGMVPACSGGTEKDDAKDDDGD